MLSGHNFPRTGILLYDNAFYCWSYGIPIDQMCFANKLLVEKRCRSMACLSLTFDLRLYRRNSPHALLSDLCSSNWHN